MYNPAKRSIPVVRYRAIKYNVMFLSNVQSLPHPVQYDFLFSEAWHLDAEYSGAK